MARSTAFHDPPLITSRPASCNIDRACSLRAPDRQQVITGLPDALISSFLLSRVFKGTFLAL